MERLLEAVARVRERTPRVPRAALVSGDGVALAVDARVALSELVDGAALTLGTVGGTPVAVVDPSPDAIRVARLLGAETLVIAGVCRALHPDVARAELALVGDHLNLTGTNPLIGPNLEALGPRFPDMTEAYDPALRRAAREAAASVGVSVAEGVLAALPADRRPHPADDARLRELGADFAAPGVAPAVIVARHAGMRVAALLGVGRATPAGVLEALIARVGADRGDRIR